MLSHHRIYKWSIFHSYLSSPEDKSSPWMWCLPSLWLVVVDVVDGSPHNPTFCPIDFSNFRTLQFLQHGFTVSPCFTMLPSRQHSCNHPWNQGQGLLHVRRFWTHITWKVAVGDILYNLLQSICYTWYHHTKWIVVKSYAYNMYICLYI